MPGTFSLNGEVAIVTSGGGVGRALSLASLEAGATVAAANIAEVDGKETVR